MILGAVSHGAGVLVPALDGAGVAVTLAGSGDVDLVALGELVALQNVADFVTAAVIEPELTQHALGVHAGLFEVAELGFGQQLLGTGFGHFAESDLYGFVAVAFSVLGLHHCAGARFNHGDRYQAAVFSEDLRHTDLFTHDRFLHCICSSCLTVSFRFRHQQEDQASSWRPPFWDSDC